MANYPPAFDGMLAAWNEADHKKMRGHLEAALSEDIHFVDPDNDISGIDAFEAMVLQVQASIPGAVYSRTSAVDSHHLLHRYHWAIHLAGKQLVQGFDVVEERAGKVGKVMGFFGALPIRNSVK